MCCVVLSEYIVIVNNNNKVKILGFPAFDGMSNYLLKEVFGRGGSTQKVKKGGHQQKWNCNLTEIIFSRKFIYFSLVTYKIKLWIKDKIKNKE